MVGVAVTLVLGLLALAFVAGGRAQDTSGIYNTGGTRDNGAIGGDSDVLDTFRDPAARTSGTGTGGNARAPRAAQEDEDSGDSDGCPDNDAMQTAHGWDPEDSDDPKPVFTGGASWEPCQWVLQSTAVVEDMPLLDGWQYTVRLTDKDRTIAVYYGDGEATLDIYGATFRYLDEYGDDSFANNACELLDFEHGYGMDRARPYHTHNGNLPCDDVPVGESPDGKKADLPDLGTADDGENGGSDTGRGSDATSEFTGCPADFDPATIGGDTDDWTEPDWEGGAWTASFGSNTELEYPGFGVLRAGGTTTNRTNGGNFSGDVSFHCDPATAG